MCFSTVSHPPTRRSEAMPLWGLFFVLRRLPTPDICPGTDRLLCVVRFKWPWLCQFARPKRKRLDGWLLCFRWGGWISFQLYFEHSPFAPVNYDNQFVVGQVGRGTRKEGLVEGVVQRGQGSNNSYERCTALLISWQLKARSNLQAESSNREPGLWVRLGHGISFISWH